ncbi:twin-arginine translocase subunit TatC [Devosia sp. 63-57]|uniref:twin-arginine translocase subunit TatC n=1 Tax=Devosia sp. 63-57 TaxID=1895751 RepID=UPI00086ABC43|nr:twin-arginine translocase subunit TatC [Devosia sp. 63-57]ODT48643.1 MAG: twin arginine-targeting protein translocase TatC [Pelagibacterium sp. SCN 63-126]ODU86527.1 MAG: twin arginine-targeting protein translocase TatC [Pelagibacterium sp. SCN 63-17]OJX45105.1 MAG: twin arginine-targeting protein translocase TatC [Devosia sp. 63-57]
MADITPKLEDKSKIDSEDELAGSEAPLLEHLIELRKRLINSAIAIVVLMVICFLLAGNIFDILLNPYRSIYANPGDMELIYTAPQEFFFTQLNLAFFGAIFLGFPYIATQIYGFVAPGLYKHERKALVPYLIATPIFFLLGAAMVYFVVLPMALNFFAGMQTDEIKLLAKVSEYLGLAMTLILAFGICFQLPVVLTLLAQIDLINVDQLKKGRRYAIVGILIVAAFITPPDPISQIGLALPMYGLYELSIISVRWVQRRREKALAAEAAASGTSSE